VVISTMDFGTSGISADVYDKAMTRR